MKTRLVTTTQNDRTSGRHNEELMKVWEAVQKSLATRVAKRLMHQGELLTHNNLETMKNTKKQGGATRTQTRTHTMLQTHQRHSKRSETQTNTKRTGEGDEPFIQATIIQKHA